MDAKEGAPDHKNLKIWLSLPLVFIFDAINGPLDDIRK